MNTFMCRILAGLLVAAAVMAGIYAFVTTVASIIRPSPAPTISPNLSSHTSGKQSPFFAFVSAVGEASNEHRTAREKCQLLTGEDMTRCNTEAKAEQQRAKKEARINYKAGIKVPAHDPVIVPRTAGGLDVVLYRAHRQWPD